MKVRNGKELGELLIRKGFVNTRGGVDRNCSFELFGITPRQLGNWLDKEEFNANQQKIIDLQSGKEAIKLQEFKYPGWYTPNLDREVAWEIKGKFKDSLSDIEITKDDLR